MGKFIKGDIIVIPFPFSDLSTTKRRPALVVASLNGDDVILCQITSKNVTDSYAITVSKEDLISGSLNQESVVRPNRIFTADSKIILYRLGEIKPEKVYEVIMEITRILNA